MSSDREQIVDIAVRYCTAMDTRDWSLLDECFAADAEIAYEGFDELRGLPALKQFLAGILGPLDATQHIVTNFVVEIDGDGATMACYLQAQHVRKLAPGGELFTFGGTYRDRLVRTAAGWRIARRTLSATWTAGNPAVLS